MKETDTSGKVEKKMKRMKSSFLKASQDIEIVYMSEEGMRDYSFQLKLIHLFKK